MKKDRIPELDLLRGICILGMILVHFLYDLRYFRNISIELPFWLQFAADYGHVLFILISGICAVLGSHSVKRGTLLFACGLAVSYVTLFMDLILGYENIRIWFGILHFLGTAMIVYPVFKNISASWMILWALFFLITGAFFWGLTVKTPWLFPLGLCSEEVFTGSDYFPVFPNLGWFLLGAAMGKTLYQERKTLFPFLPTKTAVFRFLSFLGRNSLAVYLLHQPLLYMILTVTK